MQFIILRLQSQQRIISNLADMAMISGITVVRT